mmetsp:Transcript_29542/g.42251  ORF Transcript_29542/g.42251 Transcript_29542/m.42251 type:complete len:327 (-) Transcript_29542:179-1159(-)|eukprot:CAMPEP_0172435388 /NCGR_PEP_ID=MMETSP1064-20121228/71152_1 /TAXON_ID=202472 /ORGANISM="Aulacoseira subarctica , Strain CCAP 1002/5" /LENGTH=326 /DNA_ID=CAMNT_0013183697 /DNA_START=52 /DNA_END=1032 /DNA_ORIENTATION=-
MGSSVSKGDQFKTATTATASDSATSSSSSQYPKPKGDEYEKLDELVATLPKVIEADSAREIEEYIEACDKGKGPVVACFSTAEYLSLMDLNYEEACALYENTCFRPMSDKSPNTVKMDDGTKAYPPACFNLARFRMTGKGHTKFSHQEGYSLFDRACKAGHHGSCHMQARMLASNPGSFESAKHDPVEALRLFEFACKDGNDSISCITAATMLLRGERIAPEANNISPLEAQGLEEVKKRKGEEDRRRKNDDARIVLKRDPKRAKSLLELACNSGNPTACYNLAVMYNIGDEGIPSDQPKSEEYQKKTEELVKALGGLGFEQLGGG